MNRYQDIITNEGKMVEVFSNQKVSNILEDENHRTLLHFLFDGPLTIDELETSFENQGNKKSDKTIYRYLKKLKKAGLVIEAGKRIYSDDNKQVHSKTLFSRAAKIIYAPTNRIFQDEDSAKAFKLTELLFKEYTGAKSSLSIQNIKEAIENITKQKNAIVSEIFRNSNNPELNKLVNEFDIQELIPIFDFVGWILVVHKHPEFIKDFTDSFV
ncbi:MAG: winged helix-turn-helix domain-containing protein [Asgard group archaeon]|nr:winged helix-turn-helix domain-containing protein [Asgard group archaeon]